MPEDYHFDASVRVYDEVEEAEYEAALRELQRLAEEAEDDDAMGDTTTRPARRRSKKRLSVVATSTQPRERKVLFGKSNALSATRLGGSMTTMGTARSGVSTGRASVASARSGFTGTSAARSGTLGGTAITFEAVDIDAGPPPQPKPYVAWTTISASVVAESDTTAQSRAGEFIVKKGLSGAEALSETGGLNMPLIEGATEVPLDGQETAAETALASNSAAVATAEQALTVLLADITSDAQVGGALASIVTERTPYYAALTGRALPRPTSASDDRPTSPSPRNNGDTGPVNLADTGLSPIAQSLPGGAVDEDDGTVAGAAQVVAVDPRTVTAADVPVVDTLVLANSRPTIPAEEKRKLLMDPFVEALLESTVEDTLFNLMAEAVHGEFNLDIPPRQIIQNSRRLQLTEG